MFSPAVYALEGEHSVAGIFEREAGAIVVVLAVDRQGQQKLGSGFIVHEDGFIVTNLHVLQNAKDIAVKLKNNRAYKNVSLVDFNVDKDIALIKIPAKNFNTVKLGNSNLVDVGERVMTIGNPLGLEGTVSDGLISSIRKVDKGFKVLQISVPLSHGSSGGPLFDLKGKVVGITTASVANGQNLNFAVPINYVKPMIRSLDSPSTTKLRKKKSYRKFAKREIPSMATSLALDRDSEARTYRVQSADTLYSLARKFDTTVADLMQANQLTEATIYRGQTLNIP